MTCAACARSLMAQLCCGCRSSACIMQVAHAAGPAALPQLGARHTCACLPACCGAAHPCPAHVALARVHSACAALVPRAQHRLRCAQRWRSLARAALDTRMRGRVGEVQRICALRTLRWRVCAVRVPHSCRTPGTGCARCWARSGGAAWRAPRWIHARVGVWAWCSASLPCARCAGACAQCVCATCRPRAQRRLRALLGA